MTKKRIFNPCIFIGSGFEYTISGSDISGYSVSVNGRRDNCKYATVDSAHDRVTRAYYMYMGTKRG